MPIHIFILKRKSKIEVTRKNLYNKVKTKEIKVGVVPLTKGQGLYFENQGSTRFCLPLHIGTPEKLLFFFFHFLHCN